MNRVKVNYANTTSNTLKVTLPLEIAVKLKLKPGDFVDWTFEEGKGVVVKGSPLHIKKRIVKPTKKTKTVLEKTQSPQKSVSSMDDIERRIEEARKRVSDYNDEELRRSEARKKAKEFEDSI